MALEEYITSTWNRVSEDNMEAPIVEEVRKARQDHAEKFNHDLSEICNNLKKLEKDVVIE